MRCRWILAVLAARVMVCVTAGAATELNGKDVYADACASRHGLDGRGAQKGSAITVPLPNFTDCSFVTREGDSGLWW